MNTASTLYQKHKATIDAALVALSTRGYYTPYPESPKAYAEDGDLKGKAYISAVMNNNFNELLQGEAESWVGEEISPFLQLGIGVKYPNVSINTYVTKAHDAQKNWANTDIYTRAGILVEALQRISNRFFDITYATMHTTGQAYMMSFQASGPHSNDRALEAVITGFKEITSIATETDWIKPMGKFDLKLKKNWKAIGKGIGLVIGCSTFPVWNTVPALFANLITGNASIIKPHPKAILPIAIVVAEIQKVLAEQNVNPCVVQLAADTPDAPITKQLAEHAAIKLVDYTGNSEFGNYIESLNKTVFTEKAGVNSIILDSVSDAKAVFGNIAFSACLYSGQMCTAPQNIFVPENGIKTADGVLSYDEVVSGICASITALVDNPKAGAGTLGAIQSEITLNRLKNVNTLGGEVVLASKTIVNEEFKDARIATPAVIRISENEYNSFNKECFGPIVFVIKTASTANSIALAQKLAEEKGAITCGAYTTDEQTMHTIEQAMNSVFTPVSFNFTGAAFINSHAAFSDFHVTGGNAAGNASLTTTEFIVKRFVWVGNRFA
ncbi:MAG: phenylacetic acid degradation protein PaaN [Bacteroidia bacterium]|nr:phenylacetic acid degradation protein PaaN [Bacteroidia bacterium]